MGSNSDSWSPIITTLAQHREVITIDLPGHGQTPPLAGATTVAGLADALAGFIADEGFDGVDLVGSSIGGRLVLEMARRGHGGSVVALDPGGFWGRPGARYIGATLGGSIRLLRLLRPVLPALSANKVARTAILFQLSSHPWRIDADVALAELRSIASTPVFAELLADVVSGPPQEGMPAGSARRPIVIGWGRQDRVTPPGQAERAAHCFPDAEIHWFEHCGHLPQWDQPRETVRLILDTTDVTRSQ